jgi:putative membrane protein
MAMMWNWFGSMGWGMMFWGLVMLAFWGGIIALIVLGVKKLVERGSGSDITQKHDPLDIAKERYARGDISREEFEQIKKDLS